MLNGIDAPVIHIDQNYTLLTVNRVAMDLIGLSGDRDLRARPVSELIACVDQTWAPRLSWLFNRATEHAARPSPDDFSIPCEAKWRVGASVHTLADSSHLITIKPAHDPAFAATDDPVYTPEAIMRQALDNVDCGIVLLDPDLNVAFTNDRFFEIRKAPRLPADRTVSAAEMIEANRHNLLFKSQSADSDAGWQEYLQSRVEQIRVGNYGPDEQVSANGQSIVHSCVNLGEWRLLFYYDITDLKAREQNLESVLAHIDHGIAFLDADLRLEIVNEQFFDLWNLKPSDFPENASMAEVMDVIRRHDPNPIETDDEQEWQRFRDKCVESVRQGSFEPFELHLRGGNKMMYACRAIGDRRLLTIYNVTNLRRLDEDNRILREAIEHSPIRFCVYDAKDHLVAWNPPYETTHRRGFAKHREKALARQLTYRELSAEDIPETIPKAEHEAYLDRLVAEQRDAKSTQMDRQYRDDHWLRVIKYRTPSGATAGMAIDISEMKQHQAQLEVTTTLLNEIIACMEPGLVVHELNDLGESVIAISNQQAADMLEVPAETLETGQPIRSFLQIAADRGDLGEDGDAIVDDICKVVACPDTNETPTYLRSTPSGRYILSKGTVRPSGGYIITYTDVTDMKEREQELELANKLLDDILSEMDQGLMVHGLNKDGVPTIKHANATVEELLELPGGMLQPGADYSEYLKFCIDRGDFGPDREDTLAFIQKIYETTAADELETFHRETPTGRHILVKVRSRGTGGWIGTYTDISDLKQREIELEKARTSAEEASKAKSEFVANMSHEIRTPMNGVLGMAEVLKTTDLDNRQKSFVDVIANSGNILLGIINDILDYSKISANQLSLHPAPFDLEEAIQDVAALMQSIINEKGLELMVRLAPGLPSHLVGDVQRFRQIVMNLVGNAAKFTDNGHVLIEVKDTEPDTSICCLTVSVTDTGIGIPPDMTEAIFDKFSQAGSNTKQSMQGTGLGLAIARSLAVAMGGGITCTSKVGSGSTFTMTIRCPIAEISTPRPKRGLDRTGLRILVVDDNQVNRTILSEQLESWGFAPTAVSSGSEGLEILAGAEEDEIPFEVVVLDYQMDEMDGLTVAERIRACKATERLPILLLASVDALDTQTLEKHKIQAHLVKPVKSSVLLDGVLDAIDGARSGQTAVAREPKADPDTSNRQGIKPPQITDRDDRPLILVAEDNSVNRMVIEKMLESCDCNVLMAEDGQEAVALYQSHHPEMILMDVSMPIMDGLEATRQIRTLEAKGNHHVPIVAVTAHALPTDELKCRNAGMDDYLTKPVNQHALLEKVEALLEQSEASPDTTTQIARRSAS